MFKRRLFSSSVLVLLAIASALPTMAIFAVQGWDFYRSGGRSFYFGFAGLDANSIGSVLINCCMVRDRFQWAYHLPSNGASGKMYVAVFDPETGEVANRKSSALKHEYEIELQFNDPTSAWCTPVADAERLWMIDDHSHAYEFDGSRFVERESLPPNWSPFLTPQRIQTKPYFLLSGRLTAVMELVAGQRELFQLVDGKWLSLGEIELLNTTRAWKSSTDESLFEPNPMLDTGRAGRFASSAGIPNSTLYGHSPLGKIEVLPIGSTPHLFWRLPDRLLYRRGIDLIPIIPETDSNNQTVFAEPLIVSALEPENVECIGHGWSIVADYLPKDDHRTWWPVVVGGEPAVILCDVSDRRHVHAIALRLVDERWNEFAKTTLPFASSPQAVGSCDDGSKSYLAVATGMGRTQVLALEPEGFRLTQFHHINFHPQSVAGYFLVPVLTAWSLIAGIVLTLVAMIVRRGDLGQYDFGLQTVSTASLWRRGTARVFDLTLIIGSTVSLLWFLQSLFSSDWQTFFEALQIRASFDDQPQVLILQRILMACLLWLCLSMLMITAVQGRYGVTPGKWLLGIRTVRATLRPPGFARSLVRELLLYIDSAALLCWAPGILFITFTKSRQRIGDLLADTLVVRARSLTSESRGHHQMSAGTRPEKQINQSGTETANSPH